MEEMDIWMLYLQLISPILINGSLKMFFAETGDQERAIPYPLFSSP